MGRVSPINPSKSDPSHGRCPNCSFTAWCLPANLTLDESIQFHGRIKHDRRIQRNEYLHHANSPLSSLYMVKSGFLKTSRMVDGEGRQQVISFLTVGELVGLDAIGTGKHLCDTVALKESRLCGMRYVDFEELCHAIPALQRHFHRMMSAEIVRNQGIMILLGGMCAEKRVAMFLLNISRRLAAQGFSETHFRLPMTREELGSYLGLKFETVSRAFSRLSNAQLIAVDHKNVDIRSLVQLEQIIDDHDTRQFLARHTKLGTNWVRSEIENAARVIRQSDWTRPLVGV
jgi:CRP/FNR family transcriptional regulator